MGDEFEITVNGGTIGHIGHTEYYYSSMPQDDAILKELQGIQQKLEQKDPLVSRAIGELRDAIREQNQPKISERIRDLSTGAIGTVIAELASSTLKKFLGLP